jgi:hypothetical protein
MSMCAVTAGSTDIPKVIGSWPNQGLLSFSWDVLNGSWPVWIGNLANLMQLLSPGIALLAVLITRGVVAHRRRRRSPRATPDRGGDRQRPGVWLRRRETRMTGAGDLVDMILGLTGWTQARMVHELRRMARTLQEPEPLGLDPVTINRWRRGRQRPGTYYSRLLRHLYVVVSGDATAARPSTAPQPASGSLHADEAEQMKRRRFLQYLAVLAESLVIDPDRLGSAVRARSSVDQSLMDGLEAVTHGLGRQWHTTPPQQLLPTLQHHLQTLNELRLQAHRGSTDRRLLALTAEAAALVGWELWLTGERTAADAYYALAREMSHESGHDQTTGFVLVARSFVQSTLFGGARDAAGMPVRLLNEAVAVAERTSSPHLRSFALLRRAEERGAAEGGRAVIDVERDLESAEAIISAVRTRDDGFFHYFDVDRVTGTRGTCAGLLGNHRVAIDILSQVIAGTPPALAAERSVLITDLAAVYARTQEVEYACELLGRSLSLGHRSDVNRTARIIGVRQSLLHRWTEIPSVRRLDEQLELHRARAV